MQLHSEFKFNSVISFSFWGRSPQTLTRGSAPLPRWGTPVLQTPSAFAPPQSWRRIDASLTYLRQKLYAYCYYVRIHLLRTTACAVRMRCDMTSLWAHSIGRFSCLWIGGSGYFAGHRYALLILATAKFIVRLSVCLSHVARVSRAQTADFFPEIYSCLLYAREGPGSVVEKIANIFAMEFL